MYSKEVKKNSVTTPGWILLPEQIDALTKKPYTYNATAGSFLEILFLQKFWTWLTKYIPNHIAPCVLTCLGIVINLGSCLTLLYYSPDAIAEAPSWVYLLCAVGVFLYQTLDALDGKQCLKNQDTQIEELYDHGCDSISNVFVGLTTAAACQLGTAPLMMFSFFISSMLAFYSTHWQDHVTHIMVFGKVDVSEAQFSVMCIHLITALYGQQFWRLELLFGIEVRTILGLLTILSLWSTILTNVGYILGNKTSIDEYVKTPRKKGIQKWTPVVPISILTLFTVMSYSSESFHYNSCVFVIAFGLAFAKLTIKLVIANVTYADMDIWDSCLVAPFLLSLNSYLPSPYVIPTTTALFCVLVYNLMDVARYFTYASWDLREALDAYIFTLKYKPGHPKFCRGNQGVYVNGVNNNEVLASTQKTVKE